jgi:hypothetical protein
MADESPITKAEMVTLLEAYARQTETKIDSKVDSLKHELLERVEKTETKLIWSFANGLCR